jgi:exodeoxyribonuclease VII small subunit
MADDFGSKPLSFEDAYRSLQEVVGRLEKGNLALDECVALFEQGTELVRHCTSLLDSAELKIRTLAQGYGAQDNGQNAAGEDGEAGTPGNGGSLWGTLG